MKSICVFCGSSMGRNPDYEKGAIQLGTAIANRGISLVYGGGNVGLMGVIADAVLSAGGEVFGVIPEFLVSKELAHQGLTRLETVESMHDRKARMAELSDAFIALPGGYGTLEEFCEVLTWAQLGLHQKPHGLLNIAGYYDPLLQFFDQAVSEKLVRPVHRALVIEATEPEVLLDRLSAYEPQNVDKWIKKEGI
ncbi:LOG family protein [Leptolyngbya sp. NIES-2104]|uniref:LOG family protein n=1 Tax=Leptolyngbya sp. NIES-2104 TaxID=1552121 RepID=UPI0006ECA612|nr:TIGR00730 family Rossman fold protein [Leptolyngbya sp. NIES-2104]GAP97460.1 lysine decarboxylase family [Leptolyngbya sp. NIES-2104]